MIAPAEIETRIKSALPDALVRVKDLTGTMDHYEVEIVSTGFAGKNLVARHRLVYAALAEEMKGPIHALTLKVRTPEEK